MLHLILHLVVQHLEGVRALGAFALGVFSPYLQERVYMGHYMFHEILVIQAHVELVSFYRS